MIFLFQIFICINYLCSSVLSLHLSLCNQNYYNFGIFFFLQVNSGQYLKLEPCVLIFLTFFIPIIHSYPLETALLNMKIALVKYWDRLVLTITFLMPIELNYSDL